MGKSPGRWIKTVLFGKKSSKSHSAKRSGNEKLVNAKGLEDDAISAPIISHPIPVPTIRPERHLEVETRETTDLQNNGVVSLPANQDVVPQVELTDDERRKQEEAATLTQAAFRGYLARRAFKALKGIIRLQALIRGHLVRRQAVATLSCVLGVVKLQALARGVKVRNSIVGLDIQRIGSVQPLDGKLGDLNGVHVSILRARLSANTFVRKLVASSPAVMPLSFYYEPEEPNSVQNWLECWSASRFWKPIPQPKKVPHPKTQRKHGNGLEAETGRPKRSVPRVPAANIDNSSLQPASEYEKPKRNFRKVSSHPVETAQENPQSELEKIKRNLRKVHNPVTESSVQPDVEIEKPKHSFEKAPAASGDNHMVHSVNNSGEKMKKETPRLSDVVKDESLSDMPKLPDAQPMEPLQLREALEVDADQAVVEPKPPTENGGDDESFPFSNGDLKHNEDPTSYENLEEPTSNGNHKSNRKASKEAKQERPENGLHSNSPSIPSYMAATESAKAKLRAQGSPSFSQDSAEKNHSARRHSLPSSANSKISSQSPRTRTVNSGGKSGNKAREGNAKSTQVEWRR